MPRRRSQKQISIRGGGAIGRAVREPNADLDPSAAEPCINHDLRQVARHGKTPVKEHVPEVEAGRSQPRIWPAGGITSYPVLKRRCVAAKVRTEAVRERAFSPIDRMHP